MHCVVDCQAGGDAPSRRVYVQRDWFGGVVGFEEEELGYDAGGEDFFDFAVEADYSLFQEAREDVGGVVAAVYSFCYEGHWEGGGGLAVLGLLAVGEGILVVGGCCCYAAEGCEGGCGLFGDSGAQGAKGRSGEGLHCDVLVVGWV